MSLGMVWWILSAIYGLNPKFKILSLSNKDNILPLVAIESANNWSNIGLLND